MDQEEYEPEQKAGRHKITEGKIEFKHVSFSYDGKHDVLRDVSFTLNPGRTTGSLLTGSRQEFDHQRHDALLRISLGPDPFGRDRHQDFQGRMQPKMGLVLQEPSCSMGTWLPISACTMTRSLMSRLKKPPKLSRLAALSKNCLGNTMPRSLKADQILSGERQLISLCRTLVTNP